MSHVSKYDILRSLERNGADECEAAAGYCDLLELCDRYLDNCDLSSVERKIVYEIIEGAEEFMSEEYKHDIALRSFAIRLSGIKPEK